MAKSILVRYGSRQLSWKDLLQQGDLFIDIMAKKRIPLMLPPVVSYALVQTSTGSRHLQTTRPWSPRVGCFCRQPPGIYISRTKSLEILSLVQGTSGITMPSWVPDCALVVTGRKVATVWTDR